MSSDDKDSLKKRREQALVEHDQRAREITQWVKEHKGVKGLVNPYVTSVTPDSVNEIIAAIKQELENGRKEDAHILLNVMSYLQSYDFTTADEAGQNTQGFCLAVSEVGIALRHLRINPKNAMRYLIYRYKFKTLANRLALFDFVPVLHLESTMVCNLRCIMCYQSDPKMQGEINSARVKTMPWDLFTKVADEAAARGCCAVVFAGRGEPTLNSRFSDMLRYCHDKGILDIKFNTNVMTLTEAKVREWLSLGSFLTIVFSVDAADKETFEKIRIGADFDKIVSNIRMFNRIRREEFPDSPIRTRVNMVTFRDDQDAEKARAFWSPLVDEFSARNATPEQSGSIYQYGPDGVPLNIAPSKTCSQLFGHLYVWADGTVNPCEDDYLSHLRLGNARTESIYDIWNGPKMMQLRIAHMSGRRSVCHPCNNCSRC